MRNSTLFLIALLSVALAGCGQDEQPAQPGAVALRFEGRYDQSPLLMFERSYPYEGDVDVKFQLFHFYISEVTLLPAEAGGEEVPLLDVDLVSFKDVQSEEAAGRGVTVQVADVPPGRYGGIRFGIGLSPRINGTQPADYTPGHPLTDNYWSWAMGYVFFKIEGNADTDGEGQFTDKLTFHIGLNDFYREKTFTRPIEVKGGEVLTLPFDVDLHRVLAAGATQYVDFRQVTQDHTNDRALARFLADNLQEALRMKQQ